MGHSSKGDISSVFISSYMAFIRHEGRHYMPLRPQYRGQAYVSLSNITSFEASFDDRRYEEVPSSVTLPTE